MYIKINNKQVEIENISINKSINHDIIYLSLYSKNKEFFEKLAALKSQNISIQINESDICKYQLIDIYIEDNNKILITGKEQ